MGRAKSRVLYAEDETLIASMVEGFLTDAGFETIVAHDGEKAAQMLAKHRDGLAALVIDIQLGRGPNGWDLARKARAINPRLPIIYTTGDSAYQWTTEGVPNSLAIAKPFVESQLLAALSDLIDCPVAATEERSPGEPRQGDDGSPAHAESVQSTVANLPRKNAQAPGPRAAGPALASQLTDEELAAIAMSIYRARRRRSKFLDPSLFAEPAWDMLLDLFVASASGRVVSVTRLCRAADVPDATGLRWIEMLESKGLVRRRSVSEEGHLRLVEISDHGFEAMSKYIRDGAAKFEVPMPV